MPKKIAILDSLEQQFPLAEMTSMLRRYVECESPSTDPEAVDRMVSLVEVDLASVGAKITRHRVKGFGDALEARWQGPRNAPRVLLLGHLDTVYPLGTLKSMPWREEKGLLKGPGAFDMKGGVVQMIFALRALLARGPLPCSITALLVPDEEIGSTGSRPLTEKIAKQCDAVLVLEPAAGPKGACKTARKGIARYTVRVRGVAAHAGLDFEKGASAIVEMAHQVVAISEMSDPASGLTLNPGVISGGTRPNVVADLTEIIVDVRFVTATQAKQVDSAIRKLRARDRRCRIEVIGGIERGPFVRSSATAGLYERAAAAAQEFGLRLEETAVGGGSDGNLTAALGIPTLDGLGAVGDGAHATHEAVVARDMPLRSAILARLLESFARK